VQEPEKQKDNQQGADCSQQGTYWVGSQPDGSSKEEVAQKTEIDEFFVCNHVDCNGIHSNQDKRKKEYSQAADIDKKIEPRQQQQTPSCGKENERAGPEFLVDREPLAPQPTDSEQNQS
jgi:hypothetical protein